MPRAGEAVEQLEFFFLLIFYLFIYFWLLWVFFAASGLSLVAERGLLFIAVSGFFLWCLLSLQGTGSRRTASVVAA